MESGTSRFSDSFHWPNWWLQDTVQDTSSSSAGARPSFPPQCAGRGWGGSLWGQRSGVPPGSCRDGESHSLGLADAFLCWDRPQGLVDAGPATVHLKLRVCSVHPVPVIALCRTNFL